MHNAKRRPYLPANLSLGKWSELEEYYDELLHRRLDSLADLEHWLLDRSELEAFVSEAFAWRYIDLSRDSNDEQAQERYQYFIQEFSPNIANCDQALHEKLAASPFAAELDEERYGVYLRNVRNELQLYREENVALDTEVQMQAKEHGRIFSAMTVGVGGAQLTLQKASVLLEETDRKRREAVYHKINCRILQDADSLETLFEDLLDKRHRIARHAGFDNYRDYRFRALGRFDYTADDCLDFHEAIRVEIMPLLNQFNDYRRRNLELPRLRPWDMNVDNAGADPLRPFADTDELLGKAITCLNQLHPLFGNVLELLRERGHLDLESRPGKRPGGYNMPLLRTGIPFIFMNASQSVGDLRTLLHESGHAVHAYLSRHLRLTAARKVPSEVAELAAMSMELLTMDHWGIFFNDEHSLRRARLQQLEMVLKVLPWIATIDKFQHWLYTNPGHSRLDRREAWLQIFHEFRSPCIDHSGLEEYAAHLWHKQLHLFEVPFYYIEYGMAQLGAIAIWKQYRENPVQTLDNYIAALKLGYTRPIGEIYETAGVRFDFSAGNVAQLGQFIKSEIDSLLND